MGKYVVRRLLWMVVVLFFVSIITFLLAFAVPGDPAKSIAGTHATPPGTKYAECGHCPPRIATISRIRLLARSVPSAEEPAKG